MRFIRHQVTRRWQKLRDHPKFCGTSQMALHQRAIDLCDGSDDNGSPPPSGARWLGGQRAESKIWPGAPRPLGAPAAGRASVLRAAQSGGWASQKPHGVG